MAQFPRPFPIEPDAIDHWLARHWERLPLLLPVAVGLGVALWFAGARATLPVLLLCVGGLAALALIVAQGRRLRVLFAVAALALGAGWGVADLRSGLVGDEPLSRPWVGRFHARVVAVEPLPARGRLRLLLDTGGQQGLPGRVRVNADPALLPAAPLDGAVVTLRARLMPPATAAVPGAYDFARRAWFDGIGATGTLLEPPILVRPGQAGGLAPLRNALSAHIQHRLPGAAGGIAAALATGDTGAIPDADADAMRASGLAHLLSVSGLHVSAVVGAVFLLVLRGGALVPTLALRVRLPLVAGTGAAAAAVGYTLLTGAEVPTVRACIAALLVLAALALGRDPISLRLVAAGALITLLLWPEALVGPSFQLSFAAVGVIVALHEAPRVRRWLDGRGQGAARRMLLWLAGLLLTGLAIELALLPIAAHHFHKAGLYGALANLVAIPLTTFVIMPLEALALLADMGGAGAPFWWLAGQALDLLLALARWVAAQPYAVATVPADGDGAFLLYCCGLVLTLTMTGRVRLAGFALAVTGFCLTLASRPADILVTGDGRHLLLTDGAGAPAMLRARSGDYIREMLGETAGTRGPAMAMDAWPGARCSPDACTIRMRRDGRNWTILATRSRLSLDWAELTAACAAADIVVSDRRLPRGCTPRWLKLDRSELARTGGVAIRLAPPQVDRVRDPARPMPWER